MKQIRMFSLVLLSAASLSPSLSSGADFYFKASATFADGTKKDINCERAANAPNPKMKETYLPGSGSGYNFQINCAVGTEWSGVSVKFAAGKNPTGMSIKPFSPASVISAQNDIFTFDFKTADHILAIKSFKGDPTHYAGSPVVKITEFKEERIKGKIWITVAGETTIDFEEKPINDRTMGSAGKVTVSFRGQANTFGIKSLTGK